MTFILVEGENLRCEIAPKDFEPIAVARLKDPGDHIKLGNQVVFRAAEPIKQFILITSLAGQRLQAELLKGSEIVVDQWMKTAKVGHCLRLSESEMVVCVSRTEVLIARTVSEVVPLEVK